MKIRILTLFVFFIYSFSFSQNITISGIIKDKKSKEAISMANVILKTEKDSIFVTGSISNDEGRFVFSNVKSGNYLLEINLIGYFHKKQNVFIGSLSPILDLGIIEIEENIVTTEDIVIVGKEDEINQKMDKKTFKLDDNISQNGGSVLQTMQNLPGVTVQDGKVQLRGNDKIIVLIDGKQTALTGFGNQTGLDNIPASAIDKIEIINNPSSKYDANGNAGIINIIYKQNKKEGFNGKIGLIGGLGALWIRKENLPTIRPQYQFTPKINPTLSLNYRKNKINWFLQADYLYTQTLNKNEFTTRNYNDGTIINQQLKRNRNTGFSTLKTGLDWNMNEFNSFTISGLWGSEKIIDRGDQPFFSGNSGERLRLWQFLEDELKTTIVGTISFQHKFKQIGHLFNLGFNYTYHRENEKYYFDNILPTYSGKDAFKLISDEYVADFNFDYIKPLKYGRFEGGLKIRKRDIPTDMLFIPGLNSPLDTNAGGWATYKEIIPAIYGNYVFESKKIEAELGLRLEYVGLQYEVNPEHNTYKSSGYNYTQPFPNLRFGYKFNDKNKISLFYTRRVDRPNEVDIRIFPKYDDAEIIKVGNPALRPQFTNSVELGYKNLWNKGYFYAAAYHKFANATITRISSTIPNSTLIYAIFQNVNKSYNTGLEAIVSHEFSKIYSFNVNLNVYRNQINAFTVENKYPVLNYYTSEKQEITTGNIKFNNSFHFPKKLDLQVSIIYLAPDIIPQGKIFARYSMNLGLKKSIQKDKGELFMNISDVFNSLVYKVEIKGSNFNYLSTNFNETQVIRFGYSYKF